MMYFYWIALLSGLTLTLVTVASYLWRPSAPSTGGVNPPARLFLVLLRVAIGWHCFIEGMDKLHNPAWSGEAYLRESIGPLAGAYRGLAGDRLLDKLTVPEGSKEVPAALADEWEGYREVFANHYGLDEAQREQSMDKLRQLKSKAFTWLTVTREEVLKPAPYPPPLKVALTMQERVAEYHQLENRALALEAKLPSDDKALHANLRTAKGDLAAWRSSMKKSYDAKYKEAKTVLQEVLTEEQKKTAPLAEPVTLPMRNWTMLDWADRVVEYGLVVLGIALMVGLFSRVSSLLTGLMLLSFFLAMPPLPGWPESPRAEGHYLFINKTLIEVLALGALTFLPTGRWGGVDALLYALFPWHGAQRQPVDTRVPVPVPEPEAEPVQPVG
jgi:uncharacterized membrane protein YphA (DoxX/SURF4 family)